MAFPIEEKLVVGVASSALFDLAGADAVFRLNGLAAYREYQRKHQDEPCGRGVAFPFVERLLGFNKMFPELDPVEVVLLSHNDPDTGMRVFNSIEHYGLNISRAAFTTGDSPFKYIPAYNVSLFLSGNPDDVRRAVEAGLAAGQVVESASDDEPDDYGLRVAFDFDGVLADDSAEVVNARDGLSAFHASEKANGAIPMPPGPIAGFFRNLGRLRELEDEREKSDSKYRRYLRTAIVTARSAPAHRRVATTLRGWNIVVDEAFFLGGVDKGRVLEILRPHIFFDDQRHPHLDASSRYTPSVHVPFGIKNRDNEGGKE